MTRRCTCRRCGRTLVWVASRFAWRHASAPEYEHAPLPEVAA